ncbi:hypothetical protein HGRIS_011132 [Hohenbuehelia grisea]|uniref:Uncharacterized protein n=1 Tax=Hohenbuehelia grisea TaxID=104357 RepID=A0ABR3IZ31_9AGAR
MSRVRGALSRLHIDINDLTTPPSVIDAFCVAPQLREVVIECFDVQHFELPWPQLKSLKCRGTVADCLRLLPQMDNLEHLGVQSSFASEPGANLGHLHLTRLKSISLSNPTFIDCLTLPALESATFHIDNASGPAYLSLVTRSSCTLRSLDLTLAMFGWARWPDILHHQSSLQTLDVFFLMSNLIDGLVEALTVSRTRQYLPQLRVLNVGMLRAQMSDDFFEDVGVSERSACPERR